MDEIHVLQRKGEREIKEGEKMIAEGEAMVFAGREKLQKVEELTNAAKNAQKK